MGLHYNSEEMVQWRKEVQDFLGFALRIPEYSEMKYTIEEYMAPVWEFVYRFYDDQKKLLCRLKHSDGLFACDAADCITGVPDTFGSDEDWDKKFSKGCPPVFKGFPWSFNLQFYDEKERLIKEIAVKRTFENDSRPMIHMAWYLTCRNYDASGAFSQTNTWKYFDWDLV